MFLETFKNVTACARSNRQDSKPNETFHVPRYFDKVEAEDCELKMYR